MPHGYTKDVDAGDTLRYSKFHKNGDRTEIQADILSSAKTAGPEKWRVNVRDPNGNVDLGKFGTKKEADKAMKKWMRSHKKGVPAEDKGIAGAGGGIPGMDGNGLF